MKNKCRSTVTLVWFELVILVTLAVSSMFWLGGCSSTPAKSGAPIATLCILDFKAKMCWTNKPEGKGFTFKALEESQAACHEGKNECWYAVDGSGLKRMINN